MPKAASSFEELQQSLFSAAYYGHAKDASQLLRKAGAEQAEKLAKSQWFWDPSNRWLGQPRDGSTPIHIAAREGKLEMVKLLAPLSDLKQVDSNNETALICAAAYGCDDCARVLLPGSDVEAKRKSGDTALILAAEFGQTGFVAAVLASGTWDPKASKQTEDAFDIAMDNRNWDDARLLAPFLSETALRRQADARLQSAAPDWNGFEELWEAWPEAVVREAVGAGGRDSMPRLAHRLNAIDSRIEAEALAQIVAAARVGAENSGAQTGEEPAAQKKAMRL